MIRNENRDQRAANIRAERQANKEPAHSNIAAFRIDPTRVSTEYSTHERCQNQSDALKNLTLCQTGTHSAHFIGLETITISAARISPTRHPRFTTRA